MGYVLAALSALTVPLLVWLVEELHGQFGTGAGTLLTIMTWSLSPLALLAGLYRSCTTEEERVMFFAGAVAVLLFGLSFLFDLAVTGQLDEMGVSFLRLPIYVSGALLGFWIIAQAVDYLYQRTSHAGKPIGWDIDMGEER